MLELLVAKKLSYSDRARYASFPYSACDLSHALLTSLTYSGFLRLVIKLPAGLRNQGSVGYEWQT